MAIPNIANINVGLPNDSAGSDSLYQAFIKTRDNFTQLAACASPYSNFVSGNGISTNTNSNTGTVTITNTGVTSIIAGTGVAINQSNGDVVISSVGNGNVGVTSIGVNSTTLNVSGSPVVSAGTITLNLPTITNVAGSYINPTITVDSYGRITSIANNNIAGTVTSVGITAGPGIQVTNSPVTTSGSISVTNTGVTRVSAGPGIALSSSNGNVTISATTSRGTVTSVAAASDQLVITGSPVTSSGTFFINLPANITASRYISNVGTGVAPLQVSSTTQVANLNAQYAGTVTDAVQPNITSIGTLSSLSVTGNVVTGNLVVNGNISYINVETFNVQDPVMQLGGGANGTPLTGNDNKDRGSILNYFTIAPYMAFVGYKNSNGKMLLASNVSMVNDVVTVNNYGNTVVGNLEAQGNVTGQYIIGNGSSLSSITGANVTGAVANATYATTASSATTATSATTAGTVTTAAQPNISSVGTLTSLSVSGNTTAGNLVTNNKLFINQSNLPGSSINGDIYNTANGLYGTYSGNSIYIGGLVKSFVAFSPSIGISSTYPTPSIVSVTYNSVQHNYGNIFNQSSGIFTVPVTGIYTLTFSSEFSVITPFSDIYGDISVLINGGGNVNLISQYRITTPNATGSEIYIGTAGKSIPWFLNAGDQVSLQLRSGSLDTIYATVTFGATLIAPVSSPT